MKIIRTPPHRQILIKLADAKLEDNHSGIPLCLTVRGARHDYHVTLTPDEVFNALQTAAELHKLDTANTALVNGAIAILHTILPQTPEQ
jgi:hypothetical protein